MVSSAIASRYASALVDVATAPATGADPQRIARELHEFAAVLAGSPELHNALVTPAVPGSRKRAVAGRIADQLGFSGITRNFLFVLIDHRRVTELRDIADTFEIQLDQRLGYTRAEISTASELNEAQRGGVVAELERLAGRRVRPRFHIQADLIGGVLARIGSTVYDGSVRGQLENLRRRLSAEG